MERGLQQGMEQGIERGIEQGMEQGKRKVIIEMLLNGLSYEEIARYTSETVEGVWQMRESLC